MYGGGCDICGLDGAFYDLEGRTVCVDCIKKALDSLAHPPNTRALEVVNLLDELLSQFGSQLKHEMLHRIVRLALGEKA